ncbi:MAG: PAS domain S-box protein [Microcystaceae cyanobacterium]
MIESAMTFSLAEARQQTQIPLIVTDQEGIVVEINAPFEQVFGWTATEIRGQHVTVILPVSFRDAHHLGFSRFQATEVATLLNHPLKLKALTKGGQEIWSEHYIMAEKQGQTWCFAALLRPLPHEETVCD